MHRSDFWNRNELNQKVRSRKVWEILQTSIVSLVVTATFLLLPAVPVFAQSSYDKARSILKSGLAERNRDRRALATRVLGLLTNDSQAEELALKALGDSDAEVRAAAAAALGQMDAKSSTLQLRQALKNETDISVIIAGAHSLVTLGDTSGYSVYYAVLTGQAKSGGALLEAQMKMLHDPKQMAKFGFEQGIGFVPFASYGYSAFQALSKKDGSSPIRAAAAKMLARDPDPRSSAALLEATSDKSEIIRAAALEALSQRDDSSVLAAIEPKLDDDKAPVRFTAAAAVIHLQDLESGKAHGANR